MIRPLLNRSTRTPSQASESGYVLLVLLLMVTLMVIAALAIAPTIKTQLMRAREDEMINRGTQYRRAIKAYYKKFGRYPTRLEELENTNNLRFLRKRYKDPLTGKDFKLLHFGEVKLALSGGIGGTPNLNTPPPTTQPGGSNQGTSTTGTASTPDPNADPNSTPSSSTSQSSGSQPEQSGSSDQSSGLSGPTFGGGPIVGVISTSKGEGFHEFNHKRKFSDWQFVYDPAMDRGGLLKGPNQPGLVGFGNQPGQLLQQGNNSGETTNGPIPGMQNNPNMPGQVGPGTSPQQPPTTDQPVQQ